MQGHKINLPFLVSLLDLVMNQSRRNGLWPAPAGTGSPALRNTALVLIPPVSEQTQSRPASIWGQSLFFQIRKGENLGSCGL